MKCSNCGYMNESNSEICLNCGKPLLNNNEELNNQSANQLNAEKEKTDVKLVPSEAGQQNQVNNKEAGNGNPKANSINIKDYVLYGINIFTKPHTTYKDKENQTSNTKFALIYSAIIICLMTIINLITTMISTVFAKTYDYYTLSYTSSVNFENLKYLNYFSIIGRHLIAYGLLIFGIALVYYVVCLILKKSNNYFKNLAIVAYAAIPYIVLSMVVAPILELIWVPLGIVSVAGVAYFCLILINLINEDLDFKNIDEKIHFHILCLFVIIILGYIIRRCLITG